MVFFQIILQHHLDNAGILVEPPTKITSSISFLCNPASLMLFYTGSIDLLTNVSDNCSNLALVKVSTRCFGPEAVAVTYGKLISVCADEDKLNFSFFSSFL